MGSNSRQVNLKLKNPLNEQLQDKASSLLEWKDKFDSEWNLLQNTLEELKEREKRIESKEIELEEKESELKFKYESKIWELDELEKVIENRHKEIMMSTEKQLKAKESKLKVEFELKGKQLEGIEKEINVKQKLYKLLLIKIRDNEIELDRIDKCRKEGEDTLDLLDRSIEQKTEKADTKEKEFQETLNELEILQSQRNSLQRDVLSEEKHLRFLKESVNETAHELKEKQKEYEDWVKDHPKDVLPFEVAQQESLAYNTNNGGSLEGKDFIKKINTDTPQSNPAQVLTVLREYFYQHWERRENVGWEASFMKAFISLFEKLYRTKPEIQPFVKEDAMRLAVEWEKRMKATNENSLEVLGFMLFLSTYDLIFKFDKDLILKYLTAISQHENDLRSLRPLLECTCEFIRRLIKTKDVIDAAKLICTLKLIDKFPVVPFRRKEIATRKVAALNAVKVHSLRSDSSSNGILKCDSSLEQKVEDEQLEKQKKRRNSSLSLQDRSCKCPRRALFSR